MTSSQFHCHAGEASPSRRGFITGTVILAAAAPLAARAATGLTIADLANYEGRASPLAHSLIGQSATLRGYFAPSVGDGEFVLFEAPAAPCQLCGVLHDAGANLVVAGAEVAADVSMLRLIEVTGRVEIDGGMTRIVAAVLSIV